ncbi:MAG: methanogen output domain 1-containing protein [Methanobacteriaceae archaeon]|jgi:CheY-like chemotaxis protein|nr:methanogen output domain 1-containing protein [Methanobacteriaceae archaeon]
MANEKILVVEDESIVAMGIKHKLENLGYEVVDTVLSGEDAVRRAKTLKPDLILMDIVLKGEMDGIDAANQIKKLFDIPIIYLTAYSDEEMLERARVTEPYGYILKPFKKSELNANIKMAIYKHQGEKKQREIIKNNLLADFYDFILGAIPTSTTSSDKEMREMLKKIFEQRVDDDLKEQFDERLELLELDENSATEDLLNAYTSWITDLYSEFGIETQFTPKESRCYLELLNCPWIEDAKKNPIFCLNCQAMISRSYDWSQLEGEVIRKSTIADGSPTCMFQVKISE